MGTFYRNALCKVSSVMLVIVVPSLAAATGAWAQWKLNAANLVSIDPTVHWGGVMYYKAGILWAGGANLFNSTDYGLTWHQVTMPSISFDNISDISFYDQDTGIVCTAGGKMFQTYDRGQTWKALQSNSSGWVRVCYSHSSKIIYAQTDADFGGGGFMTSTDGGSTWQERLVFPFGQKSDGFTLSRSDNIYLLVNGVLKTSSDRGNTWKALGQLGTLAADHRDCFSIDFDSCDIHRLFVVNENYAEGGDGFSHIFSSSDGGLNWSSVFSHTNNYLSGSLSIATKSEYAATREDGIQRSTDLGTTWTNISPTSVTNFGDSRSLCALNDNHLFVLDTLGNIWETRNSGGDSIRVSLTSAILTPSTSILFASDTADCDSITRTVNFIRMGCPALVVRSASIVGSDSLNYITHPLSDDSISVTLLDISYGTHNAQLVLNLSNGLQDTVSLTGFVANESSYLHSFPPMLFAADTLECDSIVRTVSFQRSTCNSPSVTYWRLIGPNSGSYTVSGLTHDSIHVGLHHNGNGAQQAQLVLGLDNGSADTVTLLGFIDSVASSLLPASSTLFQSDTIGCDSVMDTIEFIPKGCSPPLPTAYDIVGSDSSSYSVASISKDSVQVTLHGSSPGLHGATLVVLLDNGSRDTVALSGFVRTAANQLNFSPKALFMSDTISCDSLTHSVIFSRSGCSPPSIASFSIIGPDSLTFRAHGFSNDSILVTLRGIKQGTQQAQLLLQLNDGSKDTVQLAGYVNLNPSTTAVSTQDQKTDTLGATVRVPITITGLTQPEDVNLVLHYDGSVDYLGSFAPDGTKLDVPGSEWPGRSLLHIAGAVPNAIAGYAELNVFRDSNEDAHATFDSLDILTAISPCEYNSAPSATSTIYPPTGCGIPILSQLVHLGKEPVLTVRPNPAMGSVWITASNDIPDATLTIYDMLGSERSELQIPLRANVPTEVMLPVGAGVYTIAVRSSLGLRTLRVVRER